MANGALSTSGGTMRDVNNHKKEFLNRDFQTIFFDLRTLIKFSVMF